MDDWTGRYTKLAGYAVYAAVALSAFGEFMARRPQDVQLLGAIALAGSIAFYCALDARAHGRVFVRSFWLPTLIAWPVAPLFHLLRTRGARGAGHYFKHLGLLLLVGLAAFALAVVLKLPFGRESADLVDRYSSGR